MTFRLRIAALLMSAPLFVQVLDQPAHAAPAAQPIHFRVTVTGNGPDVILIPGLASSAHVWDATVTQLAATHRVHVLQVAGFAGAPAGPNADGPVIAPIVDELHAYIAANRLKAPAVIGHSMGGLIGMELALQHPADVGRLMVVDSLPFYGMLMGPQATVEAITPVAAGMRDKVLNGTQEAYAASEPQVMTRLIKSDGPAAHAALAAAVASDHRVVARAFYEDMVTDLRPQMASLKVPVTMLYPWDAATGMPQAAFDGLYTSAFAAVPNHRMQRVDGSFHFIMVDQPELFAKAVTTFLG